MYARKINTRGNGSALKRPVTKKKGGIAMIIPLKKNKQIGIIASILKTVQYFIGSFNC